MDPRDTLVVSSPSACETEVTRDFNAPRPLVFAAFTTPALVSRWMLGPEGFTMPVCDIDLVPGGKFRYVWRKQDGFEMGVRGEFVDVVPPERLVHTEVFDEDWTGGPARVTTTFTERDGVTTVTMTILYVSAAARDAAFATGMATGMATSYEQLDALLTTPE